jgi:hypothetical protein
LESVVNRLELGRKEFQARTTSQIALVNRLEKKI